MVVCGSLFLLFLARVACGLTLESLRDDGRYFLRYADAQNEKEIFSKENIAKFNPVNFYVGGIEHAILHLLYSRFITRFLHKQVGRGWIQYASDLSLPQPLLTHAFAVASLLARCVSAACLHRCCITCLLLCNKKQKQNNRGSWVTQSRSNGS